MSTLVSEALKLISVVAGESGLKLERLMLCGTMYLAFSKKVESTFNGLVDEYIPAVRDIALKDGSNVVAEFTDDTFSDLPVLGEEVIEAANLQRFKHNVPYDFNQRFAEGETINRPMPFSIPLVLVAESARTNEAFYRALLPDGGSKDERRTRIQKVKFERFKLDTVYLESPCTFDVYKSLSDEFLDCSYSTSMSLVDYYRWFQKSRHHFSEQGDMKPGLRTKVRTLLKAWGGSDEKDMCFWICRNLEIHPRFAETIKNAIREATNA